MRGKAVTISNAFVLIHPFGVQELSVFAVFIQYVLRQPRFEKFHERGFFRHLTEMHLGRICGDLTDQVLVFRVMVFRIRVTVERHQFLFSVEVILRVLHQGVEHVDHGVAVHIRVQVLA